MIAALFEKGKGKGRNANLYEWSKEKKSKCIEYHRRKFSFTYDCEKIKEEEGKKIREEK